MDFGIGCAHVEARGQLKQVHLAGVGDDRQLRNMSGAA
jgi:hypothetical protein